MIEAYCHKVANKSQHDNLLDIQYYFQQGIVNFHLIKLTLLPSANKEQQ